MKTLVLAFHPSPAESKVGRAWRDRLSKDDAIRAGIELREVDLLYPGWQLDPVCEQAAAEKADRLVFMHPLQWYSGPPVLKLWIDQVLQWNWAYGDRYALEGKTWLQAVSVGGQEAEYGPESFRGCTLAEFLRPYERTAAFVRMAWEPPFAFYGAGSASQGVIAKSADLLFDRLSAGLPR